MLTFLNLDVIADCLWRAHRKSRDKFSTLENDDISALQLGMYLPLMAVYHDGEVSDVYIGGLASKIKKKRKEVLWDHRSLLNEFSQNTPFSTFDSGMRNDEPIVAILVCPKYVVCEATEHVQFRFLTQKRLESVLRGAKTHRFDGYIVQYHQRRLEPDPDEGNCELLQCIWTTHSFDVRKAKGPALEFFSEKYRPPKVRAMKHMVARYTSNAGHAPESNSPRPERRQPLFHPWEYYRPLPRWLNSSA